MTVVWVLLLLWLLLTVPFGVVVGMCIRAGLTRPETATTSVLVAEAA